MTNLVGDPKNTKWKSLPYRRWLRRYYDCPKCEKPLLNEESESYQGHHHRRSGGKDPSDQLIVPFCLQCHNNYHADETSIDAAWLIEEARKALSAYLDSQYNVDPEWVCINALQQTLNEVENE